MIELCGVAGLPDPEFARDSGGFTVTFRADGFTPALLAARGLSERQIEGVLYAKAHGGVTNRVYRSPTHVSPRQPTLDLADAETKGVLRAVGGGRALRYVIA